MARKTLRLYFSLIFLTVLSESFFYGTYVLFLKERGLDLLEINLINTAFMVSVFFLEIPTGAIADIFGRKKSVVLGCFVFSLATFIYFLSGSFWFFVLAEVVAAVSVTLFSGAMEAWAVDSLKYHEYEGSLEHVFKRSTQFRHLGGIAGSFVGAYVGGIDLALPWLMSSVSTFFLGIFAWITMREDYREKKEFKFELMPIGKIARESFIYGWKNKAVMYIVWFSSIVGLSVQAFNMQWQVVFRDIYSLPVSFMGWIYVANSLLIVLGSQVSTWFIKTMKKEKDAIVVSQAVTAIGMILASSMLGLTPVLLGFFIHELGRGFIQPLKQSYLNKRIPSGKRATILSFESMVTRGGAVIGLVLSGWLAKDYSIGLAWLVSGIVLSVGVMVFLRLKNGE